MIIKTKWNKKLWFPPSILKYGKYFYLGQCWLLLCDMVRSELIINYLYSESFRHPYQEYGMGILHFVKVNLFIFSLDMGIA